MNSNHALPAKAFFFCTTFLVCLFVFNAMAAQPIDHRTKDLEACDSLKSDSLKSKTAVSVEVFVNGVLTLKSDTLHFGHGPKRTTVDSSFQHQKYFLDVLPIRQPSLEGGSEEQIVVSLRFGLLEHEKPLWTTQQIIGTKPGGVAELAVKYNTPHLEEISFRVRPQ